MWPNRLPRLKGFSYRGLHRYLVTVKAYRHATPFVDSAVARELVLQISPCFGVHDFEVLAYCVMPDHVHLLLEGTSASADLREAVRAWKQRAGYDWKQRTGSQLWQPGFHDHVLRDGDDTRMVVRYVLHNPVRAGLVQSAGDYPWIGSSRYTVAELATHAGDWSTDWKRR